MKKAVFIATSLDGYIARPDGAIDWLMRPQYDLDGEDYGYAEFTATLSCMVMGRRTFEQVQSFPQWPYEGKRVVVMARSWRRLPAGYEGRAELFAGTPTELVEWLGDAGETGAYIDGGQLIQAFLRDDLIDEMTLTRLPVLLGDGLPLFGTLGVELDFEHQQTRSYASGLVQSTYLRRR